MSAQFRTNYDRSILYVSSIVTKNVTVNGGSVGLDLPEGTVLGRVAATQEYIPCQATATDGSQFPKAILPADVAVDANTSREIIIAIGGEFNSDKITFIDGSTLATLPTDELNSMEDLLQNAGIIAVPITNHTY